MISWRVAEIRTLEPGEGIGEIDQAPPCGQSEDAKRTGNFKPFVERYMSPFAFVHQDQVCRLYPAAKTSRSHGLKKALVFSRFLQRGFDGREWQQQR